jgi:ADP-ribosylglycohydrolase
MAGALGDAIGAHFEGQTNPVFSIPSDLRVTDDTQLTLATCESIIELGRVSPEGIAGRMARWFEDRRITGIGAATLKSLTELSAGGHWALVGATGERSAGNGAAMRISPLAFFMDPSNDLDRRTIRDVARITHRNDEAYLGALAIILAIQESRLDRNLIETLIAKLPDSKVRDRFRTIEEDDLVAHTLAERYLPTGFVVDSVPFSILAATESNDFMDTMRLVVECGGDTDTTASMCGGLLGAIYGPEVIPAGFASQIDAYSSVIETAIGLSKVKR